MTVDLSDIVFVKRIAIGGVDGRVSATDIETAVTMLNRCLQEPPKGRLLAVEKMPCRQEDAAGTHLFWLVSYHVGFTRRPQWLEE